MPGEYVIHDNSAGFLDYTEKYTTTGHVEFVVPAPVSKQYDYEDSAHGN